LHFLGCSKGRGEIGGRYKKRNGGRELWTWTRKRKARRANASSHYGPRGCPGLLREGRRERYSGGATSESVGVLSWEFLNIRTGWQIPGGGKGEHWTSREIRTRGVLKPLSIAVGGRGCKEKKKGGLKPRSCQHRASAYTPKLRKQALAHLHFCRESFKKSEKSKRTGRVRGDWKSR